MNEPEFHLISPKKLVVFGASKSGKTTFTEYLTGNKYGEENENTINDKENGKLFLIINYII